jgi:hypothetical protein
MFIVGGISESALEEGGGYCSNKDSQRRVYTPDMAGMESLSTSYWIEFQQSRCFQSRQYQT